MVFLIDERSEIGKKIVTVQGGNVVTISHLINNPMDESIISYGRYVDIRTVLNYLDISYKVVVNLPDTPAGDVLMFEDKHEVLIDWYEFKEKFNGNLFNLEDSIEERLKHDNNVKEQGNYS